MLKLARAVNPIPAMLVISNPKGANRMAAKKATPGKKKTASRKAPVKAGAAPRKKNPAPKKRTTAAAPKRKPTKRHKPNPSITAGLGETAMTAVSTVGAMVALGFVNPMIPPVLGSSPEGRAIQTAGVGWLVGYGVKRLGFPNAGRAIQLGSAVLGASIEIEARLVPVVRNFMQPSAPPPQQVNGKQMGDLVTLPAGDYDDYYGSTPNFSAMAESTTMGDLVTMGMYPGAALR